MVLDHLQCCAEQVMSFLATLPIAADSQLVKLIASVVSSDAHRLSHSNDAQMFDEEWEEHFMIEVRGYAAMAPDPDAMALTLCEEWTKFAQQAKMDELAWFRGWPHVAKCVDMRTQWLARKVANELGALWDVWIEGNVAQSGA